MNDIFTTVPNTSCFKSIFNKDFVSVEELWGAIEELYFDKEHIQEEFDDYKEYVRENYNLKSNSEITGDLDDDRYIRI